MYEEPRAVAVERRHLVKRLSSSFQRKQRPSDTREETYQITMTTQTETKMKALHYDGPFKVSVREIDLPKIEHPDDAIIKVTTSCICGSDLHMYRGEMSGDVVRGHHRPRSD